MSGSYLIFNNHHMGSMEMVWSKTEVPNALCIAETNMQVPAFKFQPSSKMQLAVDLRSDSQKFYQGFCNYFKAMKSYSPTFTLLSNQSPVPFKVVLRMSDNSIHHCEKGKQFSLDGVSDIGCIHESNSSLDLKSSAQSLFIENSRTAQGHSISI